MYPTCLALSLGPNCCSDGVSKHYLTRPIYETLSLAGKNGSEHDELGESDVEVSDGMGRRGWEGLAGVLIVVGFLEGT